MKVWDLFISYSTLYHGYLVYMCLSCFNYLTLLCVELIQHQAIIASSNESLNALLQTQNHHFNTRGCFLFCSSCKDKKIFSVFVFFFFPVVDLFDIIEISQWFSSDNDNNQHLRTSGNQLESSILQRSYINVFLKKINDAVCMIII